MKALYEHKFPVPTPLDWNRHCVLMSLVKAYPLTQVKKLKNPGKVYADLMNLLIRLAQYGLIHCDFNEFNLLINDNEEITLIDFPQMVSTSHLNADMYFNRDVQCVRTFFQKKFDYETDTFPILSVDAEKKYSLDIAVAASGFSNDVQVELEELTAQLDKAKLDHEETTENHSDEDEEEEEVEAEEEEEEETEENKKEITSDKPEEKKVEPTPISVVEQTTEKEEQKEEIKKEDEEEEEEEETTKEGIDKEGIRKKVKRNLMKRNKPKTKVNSSKNKLKQEARETTKEGIDKEGIRKKSETKFNEEKQTQDESEFF